MKKTFVSAGLLAVAVVVVGCSSGPEEVLEDRETEDVSCFRASSCVEEAQRLQAEGRIGDAVPFMVEACESGAPKGCRLLASGWAVGSIGEPNVERAAALYRWGCHEAGDGASCHSLGELVRVGAIDDEHVDGGRDYFERACRMGSRAGCHDEAVVRIEGQDPDDETEAEAVELFEEQCEQGLEVGCVNEAYMTAAGRGTGRDHSAAAERFEEVCRGGDEDWSAHPLAGLARQADPDVYAVAEYGPDVACRQLEVLTVGRFEERVMAAVDAETDRLRNCYDEARPADERTVGRITMRAGVSEEGDGVSPQIVDDELGLDEVADCVETSLLGRHLEDYADGAAAYETQWGISFVHPPIEDAPEGAGGEPGGCDEEAIQMEVSDIFGDLRGCGTNHMQRYPDDPGAVVAVWTMGSDGGVAGVEMVTTTREQGLESCLEETISTVEIPAFDGEPCPVQVPFLFSGGERLHFSVVGSE